MTTLINKNGQMEVFATFPAFSTDEIAASWGCQSCGGKLIASDAVDKGYPQGRGSRAIKCRKCEGSLFYDLVKASQVAIIGAGLLDIPPSKVTCRECGCETVPQAHCEFCGERP